MLLGLRGFPNVQGGVETHVEKLAPLLVQLGCSVEAIVRSPYMRHSSAEEWQGVRYRRIWCPRSKSFEALLHSLLGVVYAGIKRPDVLHIHAIGPSLVAPIARCLGLRVVVTHHGPDYDRQRWGRSAKAVLKLGERLGMTFSNARIAISKTIASLVQRKYGLGSAIVPNGVTVPALCETQNALQQWGLTARKYVLHVGRLVPEKRQLDLVAAFRKVALPGWKLVLVGGSDHPDAYTERVQATGRDAPDIVCTGVQTSVALMELYTHAGLFVLPSSHEGLPISLLEALSYGLPVLASGISANRDVGLDDDCYFELGNIESLAEKIGRLARLPLIAEAIDRRREWVRAMYDWREIASSTLEVYRSAGCASCRACLWQRDAQTHEVPTYCPAKHLSIHPRRL